VATNFSVNVNKTAIFFLFFVFGTVEASQIESNHSYFKNSNFLSDYVVTIKGYGDIKINSLKDENAVINGLNTDLSVNIDIQGKIEENFKYGIQLIERLNNDFKKNTSYFGYISNYYGKFEFGNTLSTTEISRIGGDSLSIGNGGIFGEFSRHLISYLIPGQYFILKEGTLSNQFFGYYNNKMRMEDYDYFNYGGKINFTSPEFFGFQAMFSFMPGNKIPIEKIDKANTVSSTLNIGDITSYGFVYMNTFDNLGVAFSMVQEQNMDLFASKNSNKEKIKNDMEISSKIIALNINYFGFTLSTSKGFLDRKKNIGMDPLFTNITKENGEYTNYAAGYEIGNIFINYNSFKSEVKNANTFSSESFSLEIKSNKNVSFYGEYIDFSMETKETSPKKKSGKMFMLGALINFY
jgi:hypothetical protein